MVLIGVVVWSSKSQHRAVIWCDDQGGLAYLKGRDQFRDDGWPEVGETVRLNSEYEAGLTYAREVQRLESLDAVGAAPMGGRR